MTDQHTQLDTWWLNEFPYDLEDLPELGKVLPRGHWYAVEHTPDGETLVYLMRNEEGVQ